MREKGFTKYHFFVRRYDMSGKRFGWLACMAVGLMLGAASRASADDLKIDPVHSAVVFGIHHFGAGYVYGTFVGPSGNISYDPSDLSKTTFEASVDADTVDTRNEMRNKHLQSPDFFDVKQYPTITFKSTSVKQTGPTTMDVTGDLTLHGFKKSITIPMEMTGSGKGPKGETRTGFQAAFTLKRSQFGMKFGIPNIVGDEVKMIVAMEAITQ
jgi:polyisoprenoid-binding protein YceI